MNGKGSKSRITNRKAYDKNFALIEWRRRELDSACRLLCAKFESGQQWNAAPSASAAILEFMKGERRATSPLRLVKALRKQHAEFNVRAAIWDLLANQKLELTDNRKLKLPLK